MLIISRSVSVCLNGCGFTETVHRLQFWVAVMGYGCGLQVQVMVMVAERHVKV